MFPRNDEPIGSRGLRVWTHNRVGLWYVCYSTCIRCVFETTQTSRNDISQLPKATT